MNKFALIITAALCLTGCNRSFMTDPPKFAANQPPAWGEGYRSGCASGYSAAGNPYFAYEKDVNRNQTDSIYKDGWDAGYDSCKTSYTATRSR